MKKALLVAFLISVAVQIGNADIYRNRFEAGDTLVSSTQDTSDAIFLYKNSTNERRPLNYTLYFLPTEIGTNSTHYWLQIDVYIADRNLSTKSDAKWCKMATYNIDDWWGLATTSQYAKSIALPVLNAYSAQYARFVYFYPYGVANDSTGYECVLTGEMSDNPLPVVTQSIKRISHYDMWHTSDQDSIKGTDYVASDMIDLRIEKTPGQFVLPTRGYITTVAGSKIDDDSLTIYVYGVCKTYLTSALDTVTISRSGIGEFNFTLSNGTGFVNVVQLWFYNESAAAADTTTFFSEITLIE